MSEPAAARRDRRRTLGRVVAAGVLSWVLVLGGLRALVVQAEHCGDPTPAALRRSAGLAIDWLVRNQRGNGQWLYRYDRAADVDLGGYNLPRHAGVTMSLEQAAGADLPQAEAAAAAADRGIDWALDNVYTGPGWRAFDSGNGDQFGTGATGLLSAALVLRRERTGDDRYDEIMHQFGTFMTAMTTERGQVYGRYDRVLEAPVPDSWSRYFTGEIFWALTMLHRVFPERGYDEPALRIAHYIATERRQVEGYRPDLPDHWAAYAFATMTTWPGWEPRAEDVEYARRLMGIFGTEIRYESQRTNSTFSYLTRGRQTIGSGLGTIGEALTNWATVAAAIPALADQHTAIVERTLCVGGAAIERQVQPDEVPADDDPAAVVGAWFQFDITQMDDQQHLLSALLGAIKLSEADGDQR
jgi:hypothetical protein